jgi:imidazolonepropionase-like amidohydrolase
MTEYGTVGSGPQLSRRQALAAAGAAGVAAVGVAGPAEAAGPPGDALALTGATVIDVTGSPPRPDQTVLIRHGRIVGVGGHREISFPRGTTVVDLRGKFLIPGLCDMHAHSGDDRAAIYPPLYLANGVTTVREMAGLPFLRQWRDRVADGTLAGPRFVVGSPLLEGSPPLWTDLGAPYLEVTSPAEGRAAVRQVKADGADFVKVYSRLSPESYRAIVAEARRQRMTVAGHCPDLVSIGEASDAGQRSFEHVFWQWYSTSSREAEIRQALAAITIEAGDYNGWFRQILPVDWLAARSYDRGKAAGLFGRLARNRSWQVPTLVMHRFLDRPDEAPTADERLRYLPPGTSDFWQWIVENLYLPGRTPEGVAQHHELFRHRMRLVREMDRAGVPILAGTDLGTPYLYPGFSLHDELATLVAAGLTPLRALRAATLEPARYLGEAHRAGTVAPGKVADLVVLDANPLHDIRNTQRIHAVVVRGRLIDAEQRERMLDDVAAAAAGEADFQPSAGCGCGRTPGHG